MSTYCLRESQTVAISRCFPILPRTFAMAQELDFSKLAERCPCPRSKPCRLGEIHAEAIRSPLMSPCHLCQRVTELLLDNRVRDFGRRGEARSQQMTGELEARSTSLKLPRTPTAIAARFTSRATSCRSVDRL